MYAFKGTLTKSTPMYAFKGTLTGSLYIKSLKSFDTYEIQKGEFRYYHFS